MSRVPLALGNTRTNESKEKGVKNKNILRFYEPLSAPNGIPYRGRWFPLEM